MIQRMIANLVGAQTRREFLDGKEFLVVPTVMLTEGVHIGSQGPLFYSKNQLGRNPATWNHKPIVLYHPIENGSNSNTSACTPEVIAAQGVGMMLNTAYDGRLKTESWLDEPKLRKLDSRVLDAINKGETVEVSTGLWNDLDPTPGTWNGEAYVGSVINMQPDHLALLPDKKGACSRDDGAGLLRNASGDLSYGDAREQIRSLLMAKYSNPMCYVYVTDVFRTYAVYEANDKVYKIGYSVKDSKVKLSNDDPEEVRKVTSYITANECIVGGMNKMVFSLPYVNQADMLSTNTGPASSQTTPEITMATPTQNTIHQGAATLIADATVTPVPPPGTDAVAVRRSAIDLMVTSATATESDRNELVQMTESDFKAVQNFAAKRKAIQNQQYLPMPVQVQNQQAAAAGLEPWLATAPPEVAEVVRNSLARDEEEKQTLIATITANTNNKFNPEWLKTQKVVLLRGIAAMAGPARQQTTTANYAGQGEVPMLMPTQNNQQINNAGPQESLPLPRVFTSEAG